jgi:O-antigen ligase
VVFSELEHESVKSVPALMSRRLFWALCITAVISSLGPPLIALGTGGRQERVSGSTEGVGTLVTTATSSDLYLACSLALVAISAVALTWRLRAARTAPPTSRRNAIVSLTLMAAMVQVSNIFGPDDGGFVRTFPLLLMLSLGVWAIEISTCHLKVLGSCVVAVAALSLVFALTSPDAWIVASASDPDNSKALVGSRLLAGPYSQGNALGIVMSAGLPFAFALTRKRAQGLGVLCILSVIVLTGSRTSIIAAALTCCLWLVLVSVPLRLRKLVLQSTAICLGALTALLPYIFQNPATFTGRVGIWKTSLELARTSRVFGLGVYTFSPGGVVSNSLNFVRYEGHNSYVTMVSTGGLTLLTAFALTIAVAVRSATQMLSESLAPALFVCAFLALGLAETPLRLDTFSDQGWIVWLGLICVTLLRPHGEPPDRAVAR